MSAKTNPHVVICLIVPTDYDSEKAFCLSLKKSEDISFEDVNTRNISVSKGWVYLILLQQKQTFF